MPDPNDRFDLITNAICAWRNGRDERINPVHIDGLAQAIDAALTAVIPPATPPGLAYLREHSDILGDDPLTDELAAAIIQYYGMGTAAIGFAEMLASFMAHQGGGEKGTHPDSPGWVMHRVGQLPAEIDTLLEDGLTAFHVTREYVGRDVLPTEPGWAWFDWVAAASARLGYAVADRPAPAPVALQGTCATCAGEIVQLTPDTPWVHPETPSPDHLANPTGASIGRPTLQQIAREIAQVAASEPDLEVIVLRTKGHS